MKILILSDSHSSRNFMRLCVEKIRPDTIVHLGDYYEDGQVIHEEYPQIEFFQVPGNCDRYRCPEWVREIICLPIHGVKFYITHGHKHNVKQYLTYLLKDARASRADAVLYGHTHVPNCYQEPDGLWVMNPGSCGYYGGSVGLITVENNKIISCRHVQEKDLEVWK